MQHGYLKLLVKAGFYDIMLGLGILNDYYEMYVFIVACFFHGIKR